KVRSFAPMVVLATLSAVPVVESIVFGFAPVVTLMPTAPLMALKPVPDVVSISSPPFEKLTVALSLLSSVTAGFAPVFRFLAPLLKLMVAVPLVLFCTLMPVQLDEQFRLPEMSMVAVPVRLVISTMRPDVLLVSAAAMVMLALP